jgi:hypothetical protein
MRRVIQGMSGKVSGELMIMTTPISYIRLVRRQRCAFGLWKCFDVWRMEDKLEERVMLCPNTFDDFALALCLQEQIIRDKHCSKT